MPPWVAVEQAVHRQPKFFVQSTQQAAHSARWLTTAFGQDAIVLLPEAILVEATPNGVLLNMQNELGITLLELDHVWFHDGWDGIAA